jgi:hypothetical protein
MFTAEEDGDGGGMLGVGRSRGLDAVRQLHRMLQVHDFSQQYKTWLHTYGDAACLPEELRRDIAVAKDANNNHNLECVPHCLPSASSQEPHVRGGHLCCVRAQPTISRNSKQ